MHFNVSFAYLHNTHSYAKTRSEKPTIQKEIINIHALTAGVLPQA
jgi:hypothetical protein